MVTLTPGATLHGFTVLSGEDIPEIEGRAYRLVHESSKAQLLYLANNDNNKAFSISFKTPPADSTGVFHILEHSVLCGSKKYPVKEPFVNLIKTSMQTFLNAMTFPDKTMYPVASTNDQDLLNLIGVYMDAVLNPMIFQKRAIFEQEGWHLEYDRQTDALSYNGVVYNEMKGALSSPDSVLFNGLSAAVFPDTAYRFESGGDPEAIPDLTYENFLETHKRHYRLDNSFLHLYGNVNLDEILAYLNREHLKNATNGELSPHPLEIQKPLISLDNRIPMRTTSENACMGVAYVAGTAHNRERLIAIDIMVDALAGSNEAPLKRAMLDSGIAGDFEMYLVDSLLQPLLVLQLKNSKPEARNCFLDLVNDRVKAIVAEGIDRDRLRASLSRAEFIMHERDFDTADGVILAMQSMSGWLYDDGAATEYLKYNDCFADLRAKLEGDYFEQLLNELILENNHFASAEVVPTETLEDGEDERLTQIKKSLNENDLNEIEETVTTLRTLQEKDDSPEDLSKLPLLELADITAPPLEQAFRHDENTPLPCLHHDLATNDIDYTYFYFDVNHLSFEDLRYLSIITTLLGRLDTNRFSAEQLDTEIQSRLGALKYFVEIHESDININTIDLRFVVGASALSHNVTDLSDLPAHVLKSTQFGDAEKIKDILLQRRIAMEQGFISAGHSAAMSRCASYYSPAARIREELGGIDFYVFLKDLIEHYDDRVADLIKQLNRVREALLHSNQILASFTGSTLQYERFWSLYPANEFQIYPYSDSSTRLIVPPLEAKNEAFIVPADISYSSLGYDRRLIHADYDGSWQVGGRAASFDYLWNEVRVKGGAYGTGLRLTRTGPLQFYSYRDPQLDDTLARYTQTGNWLTSFDPSESAMRGYLISTTAAHDAPKKAREIARRQDNAFLSNYPANYRETIREEILSSTPDKVQKLGQVIEHVAVQDYRCVFGNKQIIEGSNKDWNMTELIK